MQNSWILRVVRVAAHWHLNYEGVEPWPVKEHSDALTLDPDEHYEVKKMTFARPSSEQKAAGLKWDKTRIIYNSHITLSDIPLAAYDYVVNGKPAIEWIVERYQVTRDKDSGIANDPNDWRREHRQPRYILDLVKRIVRVSLETMKIVGSLPTLNERQPAAPDPQAKRGRSDPFLCGGLGHELSYSRQALRREDLRRCPDWLGGHRAVAHAPSSALRGRPQAANRRALGRDLAAGRQVSRSFYSIHGRQLTRCERQRTLRFSPLPIKNAGARTFAVGNAGDGHLIAAVPAPAGGDATVVPRHRGDCV